MTNRLLTVLICAVAACAKAPGTAKDFVRPAEVELSPPSKVCQDPDLQADDLCFPGMHMERWLQTGELRFVGVDDVDAGTSGIMKLLTGVVPAGQSEELFFYVKWKPANSAVSRLNNSPRKERAAYEVQKLFLPDDRWVVPPSVMRCLPSAPGRPLVEGRVMAGRVDCVWGQLSYWVSPLDAPGEVDWERIETDTDYARALGDLNILMYVIDHKDAHKDNWLLSDDPDRMRAVAPDNGVAFSGMRNPFVKNYWGNISLESLPADTIALLRTISDDDLHALHVLETWTVEDRALVRTEDADPDTVDGGVHMIDDTLTHGLRAGEIRRIRVRIDDLLARVDSGEIGTF